MRTHRYLSKSNLLITSVLFIVILAGCSGGDTSPTPTETPQENPYREEAIQEVDDAEQKLSTLQERYNHVHSEMEEARKRGVDTNSVSNQLNRVESDMETIQHRVSSAQSSLDQGNYRAALNAGREATQVEEQVGQDISSARQSLEQAYQQSVQNAQSRLQTGNEEYQIALAYVNSAGDAGADTTQLESELEAARNQLQEGVQALEEDPPNPQDARNSASEVIESSTNIQDDAVEAGKLAIANDQISNQEDRLSSPLAQEQITSAKSNAEQGNFQAVEQHLRLGQAAESVARAEQFNQDLQDQSGIALNSLQDNIRASKDAIRDGQYPDEELNEIRSSIQHTNECLDQLQQADSAIGQAEQSASWIASPDLSSAESHQEAARQALSKGDIDAACQEAEQAQSLATQERKRVRDRVSSNPLFGVIDLVHDSLQGWGVVGVSSSNSQTPMTIPDYNHFEAQEVAISYSPPSNPTTEQLDFSTGSVTIPEADVDGPTENGSEQPTTPSEDVDFATELNNLEECGLTCRRVTGTLENVGGRTAHNVIVNFNVYTGGDLIWDDSRRIGTLEPGEERQITRDIDVGIFDGQKARSNGQVTVRITIESDETTEQIEEVHQV